MFLGGRTCSLQIAAGLTLQTPKAILFFALVFSLQTLREIPTGTGSNYLPQAALGQGPRCPHGRSRGKPPGVGPGAPASRAGDGPHPPGHAEVWGSCGVCFADPGALPPPCLCQLPEHLPSAGNKLLPCFGGLDAVTEALGAGGGRP